MELPNWPDVTFNLVKTGHLDFVRVFILRGDGCQIGRMTVFKGQFDHVKWYKSESYREFDESDFVKAKVELYFRTGKVLSRDQYNLMVAESIQMSEHDLQVKELARLTLPDRKRKKLQGKNPRRLFYQALMDIST